jgi:hypothetical protein
MKTDDLIDLLAADTLPVQRHAAPRRLALALLVALPATALLMWTFLGINPQLRHDAGNGMFWAKLAAPLLMALAALQLVARLGRPGARTRAAWVAWCVPIAALWLLALASLLRAPVADYPELMLGRTWRVCAENIVLLSLPAFIGAIWVLRSLAPVRLALAGAGAGALSGAVATTVYALHCPELAAPFVAIWYVLGMAACVGAGALLGPRLLRW